MTVKIQNLFKNNFKIFVFFGLILLGISACAGKKDIDIISSGNQNFTGFKVNNQYGKSVLFSGSSTDKGAIGYEMNGEIFWVKGRPEISKIPENVTQFTWKTETSGTLIASVEKKERKLLFSFQLKSSENIKPSRWFLNILSASEEYFTGVFERVIDGEQSKSWVKGITTGLNLRNERVEVILKPTVSAYAPFFISSENYGMFFYGTWPGVIDFCKENSELVQISFEGPEMVFSLMMDETPAKIVQQHALETGPSVVPPKWAFGPWRWRDEHFQGKTYFDSSAVFAPYNRDVVEDILMMEAYGIPCSAYWIDRPWGPGQFGFDDYKIDYKRLPNFENMVTWLNKKNIEVMLWIGPFVMGEMADVAEANHYDLVSKPRENARQVLMDFSNPEAVKWWRENGPAKLAKLGVKGFKLDRADGEKLIDSLKYTTLGGVSYRENYNDYPRQYVKATYEAVEPILKNDFILFPRVQYTGSAKYGGMWAGDIGGTPEGFRAALIAMQRCAVMGYPIWGSDTGGYWRGFFRDVTKRWLGFSCFSPVMEVGPTENRGFWNLTKEPKFDPELIATWRLYANIRVQMVDYLQGLAVEAHETGMPVARPLFLEYPKQPEAWKDWQTYKLGPDLLVSVNWETGKTSHRLYLPKGETWLDLWNTGKEYKGGQYIDLDLPDFKTAVFLRKGSTLKLPDFNKLWEESLERAKVKYTMSDLEAKEGWVK
jgi:alpha-D-xyloside xylohydrolase